MRGFKFGMNLPLHISDHFMGKINDKKGMSICERLASISCKHCGRTWLNDETVCKGCGNKYE